MKTYRVAMRTERSVVAASPRDAVSKVLGTTARIRQADIYDVQEEVPQPPLTVRVDPVEWALDQLVREGVVEEVVEA